MTLADEPDIVETLQLQNDKLSRQVAQLENDNKTLRSTVSGIKESVEKKETEKTELTGLTFYFFIINSFYFVFDHK